MVVDCSPVKFWKVEEPVAKKLAEERSEVMKALVPFKEVAKKLVVVAALPVALMKVKFCKVEEPVAKKLVVEA